MHPMYAKGDQIPSNNIDGANGRYIPKLLSFSVVREPNPCTSAEYANNNKRINLIQHT